MDFIDFSFLDWFDDDDSTFTRENCLENKEIDANEWQLRYKMTVKTKLLCIRIFELHDEHVSNTIFSIESLQYKKPYNRCLSIPNRVYFFFIGPFTILSDYTIARESHPIRIVENLYALSEFKIHHDIKVSDLLKLVLPKAVQNPDKLTKNKNENEKNEKDEKKEKIKNAIREYEKEYKKVHEKQIEEDSILAKFLQTIEEASLNFTKEIEASLESQVKEYPYLMELYNEMLPPAERKKQYGIRTETKSQIAWLKGYLEAKKIFNEHNKHQKHHDFIKIEKNASMNEVIPHQDDEEVNINEENIEHEINYPNFDAISEKESQEKAELQKISVNITPNYSTYAKNQEKKKSNQLKVTKLMEKELSKRNEKEWINEKNHANSGE